MSNNNNKIVIGEIQCKTYFPKNNKEKKIDKNNNNDSPYIHKHEYINYCIKDLNQCFSFLDTHGYSFDPYDLKDQYLLQKFINGLPEFSDFNHYDDENVDLTQIPTDENNSITHVIFPISAYDIFEGVNWFQSWYSSGFVKKDIITTYAKLYHLIVEKLSNKYNKRREIAIQKIIILISDYDKFIWDKPKTVIKKITSSLCNENGISNYHLFFTPKNSKCDKRICIQHICQHKFKNINQYNRMMKIILPD